MGCSEIVVDGRGSICKLPIGRVDGSADIAALAVHIMSNKTLTGATFDIDGGQMFVL